MKKTSTSAGKSPAIIVVVDANPSDYVALAPLAEAGEIDLRFLLSGRSALRQSRHLKAPLWMINVDLPDHSGFDVQEMCFHRKTSPLVLMVADEYFPEDELRSLELGVTKYLCKPVDPAWLHDYLHHIKVKTGHATPTERLTPDDSTDSLGADGPRHQQDRPTGRSADRRHARRST